MKKAILIVMTIAVLGALGAYVQQKPSAQTASSSNTPSLQTNSSSSSNASGSSGPSMNYKDGTYQGSSADTPYGVVQIAVVISGGKITDVNFNQMPNDQGHSREVTAYAQPLLKQTTLQAQSANIEFVSGATSTSYGYRQSLQAALDRARTTQNPNSSNSSAGSSNLTPAAGTQQPSGQFGGGTDE